MTVLPFTVGNATGQPPARRPAKITPTKIEGEDLAISKTEQLRLIAAKMLRVSEKMEGGDASPVIQREQQLLLSELSRFAERVPSPKKKGKANSGKDGTKPRRQASNSTSDADTQDDQASKASSNAISRPRGVSGSSTEGAGRKTPDQLVERVWGHLPEKIQNRMRASGTIRFLPKYRKLIEEYYKRLAERTADAP